MSGGHWDYLGAKIKYTLQEVAEDDNVQDRFPLLSKILYQLGDIIYDIEQNLDWDICSDHKIKDDKGWEEEMVKQLEGIIKGGEYERPSV